MTLDDLRREVRYAVRGLWRAPAFTAVAVLSLAVGIGANTAIFSVVDALMWRPLPVAAADRLIVLEPSGTFGLTYANFERLRDSSSGADLSAIARTDRYNVGLSGGSGDADTIDEGPVRVALVSGNYFATMGVTAAMGRGLGDADDRENAAPVAVISDGYWNRRFGRSHDVLGRRVTASGVAFDVVGVAPPGFTGEWVGRPADVWLPIVFQPRIMTEIPLGLPSTGVTVVGRLRAGVPIASSRAELQLAYARDLRERAGPNPDARQLQAIASARLDVAPGARGFSPQRAAFGQSLTILMLAVGLVLLVACANIANLMLSRADARRRELSVRLALGASRARLARQMLVESLVVSSLAGATGLIVARAAVVALATVLRAESAGRGLALTLDLDLSANLRWLLFTGVVSCVSAIVFGLVPAVRASSLSLAGALGARGADTGSGGGSFRAGRLFVVSQVACSLVLLVGAGLFARTLRNLSTQDLGFARDHLLLVWTLPGQTGGRGTAAAPFWQSVTERLAALPGVVSAGASNQGVLNGAEAGAGSGPSLRVEGGTGVTTGISGWRSFVTPGFFESIGIPLVAGRDFTERDTAAAPRVVTVNQTFARHYFGDGNPVGRHVWFPEDAGAPTEIVGVTKDSTGGTPRESLQRPGLTYFSYRDKEAARRLRTMTIAVRTHTSPIDLVPRIRQALRELDPNLPIVKIDTVDEQLADVLIQERVMATLSGFFGAIALLLACLGLYGVVSYSVGRRTSEIGIRIALGATRANVLALVVGESLWLVGAGLGLGIVATIGAARLVAARLFGVSATDPLTIAGATMAMIVVSIAAALVPAARAACVDPMVALRTE